MIHETSERKCGAVVRLRHNGNQPRHWQIASGTPLHILVLLVAITCGCDINPTAPADTQPPLVFIDEEAEAQLEARERALKAIQECAENGTTKLDLRKCRLSSLPKEIWDLEHLTDLDLSINQLEELPPEIGQLTNLVYLKLGNNRLTSLPPELWTLTKLQQLSLYDTQIATLPPEIGNLTNLTQLTFSRVGTLETIPAEIELLTKLEHLHLYSTRITDADLEHIKPLKRLKMLNVTHSRVTKPAVEELQKALPKCYIWSGF